MSRFAHVVLLAFVLIFAFVGVWILGADVAAGGQLHLVNAVVGGGALVLAVALALPVELRTALSELMPSVLAFRQTK